MALKKEIQLPNGIVLKYHRVAMVKVDTNQQTSILLHSYLNEEGRNYEKSYAAGEIEGEPTFPYVSDTYITAPYDENMNVLNAYEYLKKLPEFEGAIDI